MTVAPYNTRETEFDLYFALKVLLWSQRFLSTFFAIAQQVQCNGCRVFFLLFWERKLEKGKQSDQVDAKKAVHMRVEV